MTDNTIPSFAPNMEKIMKNLQVIKLHHHRNIAPVATISITRIMKSNMGEAVQFEYDGKDESLSKKEFYDFLFELLDLYSITYVSFNTIVAGIRVDIKWRMKETLLAIRKIQKIVDSIDGTENEYVDEDADEEEDGLDECPWAAPTSGWKPADIMDFYRNVAMNIRDKLFKTSHIHSAL